MMFVLIGCLTVHAESVYYGFTELTLDESFSYKFVKALDTESQKAVDDLLAGKKETDDRAVMKRADGEWYVRKDYKLPEGNYYESSLYMDNHEDINIILPKIEVIMENGVPIDELLGLLGNKVTLMSNEANTYYLSCQAKTSEEVLDICLIIYGCAYDYGIHGVRRFQAIRYRLDPISDNYMINKMKDSYQSFEPNSDGEVLIYEMDWEGVEVNAPIWDGEKPDWDYEGTDEGLALTNPTIKGLIWAPQVTVVPDAFPLEIGHDYIVRLTLKVPSDGTYQVNMGSWSANTQYQIPVTASDEWQKINVVFPKFGWDEGRLYSWDADYQQQQNPCHVILQCGWMVGTTIVKKVQVIENTKGGVSVIKAAKAVEADDAVYSLGGIRLKSPAKGINIIRQPDGSTKKVIIK